MTSADPGSAPGKGVLDRLPDRSADNRDRDWLLAWSHPRFRWAVTMSVTVGLSSPFVLPLIFNALNRRVGWHPPDPVLTVLAPHQVSWAIFALLLPTLVVVAGGCLNRPWVLIRGAVACAALYSIRALTMTVVPLAAPPGLIPLRDPLGQLFYPGRVPETRDLFFSGHTAIMFLLIALVRRRAAKAAVALVACAVGMLLLVQHAHWTVDVLSAPVFAALCWWLSGLLLPNPFRSGAPPVVPAPDALASG